MSYSYPIEFVASFSRREPVLRATKIKYQLSPDRRSLELERSLDSYSPHERDVVESVLNPTSIAYFNGLDLGAARATAVALQETYTQHNGKWE